MSDDDIRQERDELQQVLLSIATLVAPFTDEDITDPTCDPDLIVRAVESAVAHTHRPPRLHRRRTGDPMSDDDIEWGQTEADNWERAVAAEEALAKVEAERDRLAAELRRTTKER